MNATITLSPDEGFDTIQEADGRYEQQLQRRASEGFVQSFSFDPMSDPAGFLSPNRHVLDLSGYLAA